MADEKHIHTPAQPTLDFDLLEVVAMGICAKTAIKNGGAGHGCWWELGTEAKDGFRDIAKSLLAAQSPVPAQSSQVTDDELFDLAAKAWESQTSHEWYTDALEAAISAVRERLAAQPPAAPVETGAKMDGIVTKSVLAAEVRQEELATRNTAALLAQRVEGPRLSAEIGGPTVIDFDDGEISVRLNGKELRGWSYSNADERRTKMLAAREYVEGWCDGRTNNG